MFLSCAFPLLTPGCLPVFHRRFGDGDPRTDTCNVPSGSVASSWIDPPIFDSIFPEHRSKPAAERNPVELYVRIRLPVKGSHKGRVISVPPEVLALRDKRGVVGETDCRCHVPLRPSALTHSVRQRLTMGSINMNILDRRR